MQKGMPKTFALAKQYAYGTTTACAHPSLPNYLCIAFGTSFGIKDDKNPSSHKLKGQTVFGQAIAAGKTAATYGQSQPSKCAQSNSGAFAVRHMPWNYAVDAKEKAECKQFSLGSGDLDKAIAAGTLPTVGMVVPNKNYDAHDGSLAAADKWFTDKVALIKTGADWKSGHLAIVLTADEDDKKSGNKVLTVVIHPALHAKVATAALTHYSLSGAMSDVSGSPRLLNAKTALPFWAAFGLTVN
jgi:acid phosphatase